MTEVNRSNFDDGLARLFCAIREADFISIDTNAEVTGFLGIDESFNDKYLSGQEWYNTIVAKQRRRSPLDFGVTAFRRTVATQEGGENSKDKPQVKMAYDVKTFFVPMMFAYVEEHDDFYNDPDETGEEMLEIDGFGMEFVQRTGLDLNLSLYNGTPFVNENRRKRAEWFMRKHPEFMTIEKSVSNGDLDVYYFPKVIKHVTEQDISTILERLRGIAKFFDVVAETKVPVVGHNLLIKLILLYKDFVEYLPKDFPSFVDKLKLVLPQFYDTKLIAWSLKSQLCNAQEGSSEKYLESHLESHCLYDLFRALKSRAQDVISFNLDKDASAKEYAEEMEEILESDERLELDGTGLCQTSGFDSLIAGIVFTKLTLLKVNTEDLPVGLKLDSAFFEIHASQWKNKFYVPNEIKEFADLFAGL